MRTVGGEASWKLTASGDDMCPNLAAEAVCPNLTLLTHGFVNLAAEILSCVARQVPSGKGVGSIPVVSPIQIAFGLILY